MARLFNIPMGGERIGTPPNHGELWTMPQKQSLYEGFTAGHDLDKLCDDAGRSRIAVLSKLVGIGLLLNDCGRYFYAKDPDTQASPLPQPTENDTMPIIEVKTFIAGKDATAMTDMQIFTQIGRLEDGIEVLRRIKTRPVKLQKLIDEMQADVQGLVDYVDSRDAVTPTQGE